MAQAINFTLGAGGLLTQKGQEASAPQTVHTFSPRVKVGCHWRWPWAQLASALVRARDACFVGMAVNPPCLWMAKGNPGARRGAHRAQRTALPGDTTRGATGAAAAVESAQTD